MSWALILAAMLFLPSSRAVASDFNCLSKHLLEARRLNGDRREPYADLAELALLKREESYAVSDRLISSEVIGFFSSRATDVLARKYEEAGIHIVCDAVVSMNGAPEQLHALLEPQAPPALLAHAPQLEWSRALDQAYRDGGEPALIEAAERILNEELKGMPRFFCMGRHILESVIRIAALAPRHIEMARSQGLSEGPLRFLSDALIKFHIDFLAKTGSLDTPAAKLQARGIPIICNDVPPIPKP